MRRLVEKLGGMTLATLRDMGRMLAFLIYALYIIIRLPGRPIHVLKQIHFIGAKSLFVIVLNVARQ